MCHLELCNVVEMRSQDILQEGNLEFKFHYWQISIPLDHFPNVLFREFDQSGPGP